MHQSCHGWKMTFMLNTETDLQNFTPNAPSRTLSREVDTIPKNIYTYTNIIVPTQRI